MAASIRLPIRLVRQWQPQRHTILRAGDFRDMTLAGDVFHQVNVSRLDRDLLASGDFDLPLASERDHVLASWRSVPIGHRTGKSAMQFGSSHWKHLEDVAGEFRFDFLGVRQIVGAR